MNKLEIANLMSVTIQNNNKHFTDKMFIDDERLPIILDGEYFIIRSFDEFVDYHTDKKYFHRFITFDHDLADEKTGYDIVHYMINCDLDDLIKFPKGFTFEVHSMNPVGKRNIQNLLQNYLDYLVQ